MKKNNIRKDFFWNSLGVTLNAFTSLFYFIFVTQINGSDKAGIFTFAFSIALLIQVIGYYSGRVFQVTEKNKDIDDCDFLYSHVITSLLMIIIGFLFCIIRKYDVYKIIVIMMLILFRAIESFIDSVFAIIQKNNSLYKVGISYTIKSILSIILFLVIDLVTKNIIISICSLLGTQLIVLIFYDLKNINITIKKINKVNLMYIYKTGFYTFIFTFLTQFVLNAPKLSIDNYLSNNEQTVYGIISMPATFMILLAQYFLQPFVTKLNNFFSNKDYKKFNKYIIIMLGVMSIIGIVVTIIAYFIGIPVLNILYKMKLETYKIDFTLIIIASIFLSLVTILSNVLIIMRKTFGQVIMYFISSVIIIILSLYMVSNYKIYGAVISYLSVMILLFLMYYIYYCYSIKKGEKYERS